MSPPSLSSQNDSVKLFGRGGWLALGAAVIALGAAAFVFLAGDPAPVPAHAAPEPSRKSVRIAESPTTAVVAPPVRREPPPEQEPAASEPTIAFLEGRFRAALASTKRVELSREIAAGNDAEAVQAIGRLFRTERHPAVKLALLTNLADIDETEAPAARFQIAADALRGESREVRMTALGLLNRFEDRSATALLHEAMLRDPDHEVRMRASALYRARIEDTEP